VALFAVISAQYFVKLQAGVRNRKDVVVFLDGDVLCFWQEILDLGFD